ncbi:ThiF family adenylyltransferase [Aneurinibacillus tyrosinisolvens]|uniref:ThiF family adenylyltransferase n=1 Tax=Aneurinibacillus tyrosinisolvens TaxID=1443435 RepID=UPI00063FB527|nr:ThiF family adenylyltransferase [Aneurinibacillus tyrosinisolvens]
MQNFIRLRGKQKRVFYKIVVVGTGGNGSHFVRNLCQISRTFMNAEGYKENVVDISLVDADRVEAKNLNNQIFSSDDIADYKVEALAERYGEHYGLNIKNVTEFIKEEAMLHKLFHVGDVDQDYYQVIPVLVGMVDNNKSRQLFHRFFHDERVENLLYLDAGIDGIVHFEKQSLTREQRIEQELSGFSGQIVLGLKWAGEVILPPITEVFPDILNDIRTAFPGESCGELVLNNPQRVMTNQYAAQLTTGYINNLYQQQWIFTSATTFNAQFVGARATFLTDEQVQRFKDAVEAKQA